jgi:hypothetical protein
MAFSKLLSLSINSSTNQFNGFSHRNDPQQLWVGSSSLRETNQHIARDVGWDLERHRAQRRVPSALIWLSPV